jgi:predicted TIM-barrel fold metal-dependent hydrolase
LSLGEAIRSELAALGGAGVRPFDVHSHTGADIDGSTRSAEEHVHDLEAVGGRSVVFPLCVESGYAAENRRVLDECRRHEGLLVPFARIDPRVSGGAEAAAALADGARGIKLHPRGEEFRLEHPNVDGIFAAAAEAGAPVLIHAGAGVGSFGATLTELASRHRRCPIVLAHAGISDLAWLWRVLPEHPNVYFDTAWWNPPDLLALFALVPPGRILFGTDAPYMGVELGMATTLRAARFAGLSEDAIELVMGVQLEAMLSGADPFDGGPAPGPTAARSSPAECRVASYLGALGGAMLAGGDPTDLLGLATAAADVGDAGGGRELDPRIAELVGVVRSGSEESLPALALALSIAATPGVGLEVAAA